MSFRASLRPNYAIAWRQIVFCILMMVTGFAAHLLFTIRWGNFAGFAVGIVTALWIGFWLNALLTFGHEAAHFNLAAGHGRNDILADWSIWLFFPQTTKAYRRSHWQHHLHLGDPEDTEISYQNCLSPWFLTKTLTGIYLITLVFRYAFGRRGRPKDVSNVQNEKRSRVSAGGLVAPLRTVATHGVFVCTALYFRCYATAIMWVAAAVFVFPSLATMRQVLEHRSAEAHCDVDYMAVPHGAVNRMFGSDVLSEFYGAAGFNRHLLHHWDPTVSYTCFDAMETYLNGTPLKARLESARSTYLSSLAMLIRKAVRDRA